MASLKVFLVNLALILILSVAIEVGVRLLVPEIRPLGVDRSLVKNEAYGITPGLEPGQAGLAAGSRFEATTDGFWKYNVASKGAPGWLLLGDSVTMGIGVDPDSTFAGRIARSVSDSLRIVNPSLMGHNSHDYLNLISHLGKREDLQIARATIFWCLNDVYSNVKLAAVPGGTRIATSGIMDWVRANLRSYQWLKAVMFDRPRDYYAFDAALYGDDSEHLESAYRDLVATFETAHEAGIEIELVLLPYEFQFRQDDFDPQQRLMARLHSSGIRVIDAATFMREREPRSWYLYGDGIHFSRHGHDGMAEELLKLL